jgi:Fe-S cluster assembly iron-binding protein IscA
MFQVSEKASKKIKEFFKEKSLDDAIRILMFEGG